MYVDLLINMSTEHRKKHVVDLTADEFHSRLLAVVINALNEQKALNLPLVYKNSMCLATNQFIHEYPDGQKFLISQDITTSEETIIKLIQ